MKAALLSTLIIILVSVSSYSIKSLSVVFDTHLLTLIEIADSSLAKTFFDKGNDLLKELKYDSAIVFFGKAKMIYEKENLWENYFNCLNNIASVLRENGEIDSSIVTLEDKLEIAKEKLGGDNLTYAKMKNLLGYSYMTKANFNTAIKFAVESLDVQLKKKNYPEAADTYYLLGVIYFNMGEFDNSLKNLDLGLKNIDEKNQKILISNIYNSMGQALQQKGNRDKAIECYKLSVDIKLKECAWRKPRQDEPVPGPAPPPRCR